MTRMTQLKANFHAAAKPSVWAGFAFGFRSEACTLPGVVLDGSAASISDAGYLIP